MKKTTKIRLWAFSLAAVLLIAGFWLDASLSLNNAETHLEYVYLRALGDLTDYVSGMQTTLHKAMFAGTAPMQSGIAAQLLEQSGGAKAAMAALPFSQERTERISRFLSQTGDYALALSRKAFSGSPLEKADLQGLSSLRDYADRLAGALTQLQARLTAEQADVVKTVSLLNNVGELEELALLDDDLDEVAEEFASFPTLLYDGPFSDHISRREPAYLKNRGAVNQEEAAAIAAGFLQCPPEELEFAGEGGGQLGVWSFTWGGSMVNITKLGGEPAYYRRSGSTGTARMGYSQALQAAREYLSRLDLPPMTESYYILSDGLCAINFHTTEEVGGETALCYPDLVKVVIELNQGGAVELDCTGYLMNHQERGLAAPSLTQEAAQASLSPALQVDRAGLAVIPTPGLDEVLCWEFHCTAADGTEVLSYINAQTGMEEQLYLVQRDEHGVLTV